MDLLRLFKKSGYREPAPPALEPRRRWRLLAPLRRWVHRAEQRPGFLIATGCLAVGITVPMVAGSASLALGPVSVLGFVPVVVLVYGALHLYVQRLHPKDARRPQSQALLAAVIILVLVLVRLGAGLAESVNFQSPHLPLRSLLFAAPGALAGVLLAVLFNARLAFAGSLAVSILATFMVGVQPRFEFFLYTFLGCLAGTFGIAGQQERTGFFKAGGLVAAANVASLLGFRVLYGFDATWVLDLAAGLANGLVVGVLATGLLPLLEYLFDAATDFRLLELANLNQPLLKYLVLTAPGTYHHSIVMGTLAEAAAEAIGANPLLCRVGAYYHDIGKTRKPGYFAENQGRAADRHAKLAPHLSSLVVMSHVRAGVELAEAHGLPRAIVDLIPQHHGTRLVSFFYQKAREATDPSLEAVAEEAYRYAGPRPQTREAAILMLADAVEASARALDEPTPSRVQGVVQTVINAIFVDGQLDECDLTLRDLHLIAKSFVRVLAGMFHSRVEYPAGPQDGGRRRDDDGHVDPKPAAEGPDRHAVPSKGRRGDARRGGPEGGRVLAHPDR
jgi:putative nucleotidyltransferase with HDIG domain